MYSLFKLKHTIILVILFNAHVRSKIVTIHDENFKILNKGYFQQYCSNHCNKTIKVEIINNSHLDRIESDAFEEFRKLKFLNLSKNNLTEISFNIPTLLTLYLDHNKLEEAPNLKNFPKINELVLTHNAISKINYISNETQLKRLDLSYNPLKYVGLKLGSLEYIISKLTSFDNVEFDIQCSNLQYFDTNHKNDTTIKNIVCKNNGAIIIRTDDEMKFIERIGCTPGVYSNVTTTNKIEKVEHEPPDHSQDTHSQKEEEEIQHDTNPENECNMKNKETRVGGKQEEESVTTIQENGQEIENTSLLKVISENCNCLNFMDIREQIDKLVNNMRFFEICLIFILTFLIILILFVPILMFLIHTKINKIISRPGTVEQHHLINTNM